MFSYIIRIYQNRNVTYKKLPCKSACLSSIQMIPTNVNVENCPFNAARYHVLHPTSTRHISSDVWWMHHKCLFGNKVWFQQPGRGGRVKRGVVCERVDPKNNQAKVKINAIARQQNARGKKLQRHFHLHSAAGQRIRHVARWLAESTAVNMRK